MAKTKIDSTETTDISNISYESSAAAKSGSNYYEVDQADDTSKTTYQNRDFLSYLGAYNEVSELAGMIDRKAQYVVGRGYKIKRIFKKKIKKSLEHIRGNGLDSFNSIMYNAVRTYTTGGDFFAEIIKNKRGELRNLKPLNPANVKIHATDKGIISAYEVVGKDNNSVFFEPKEIFHLAYNRISDEIHGESTIKKLMRIIEMRREAMNDLRVVFHRYVKPLWIFSVDTDDTTEITNFKGKVDETIEKAENLVVPKDTVSNIESVSIPQYSNLDPIPWLKLLQTEFLKSEGVPGVVMGHNDSSTSEAESKILYLSWQQVVEFNQMFLEEQIKAQLGIDLEFEFPASIEPDLISDEKKDPSLKSEGVNPRKDQK